MAVRLTKPWIERTQVLQRLHGNLGVFQLADFAERVLFIGFAGGNSAFGLKGEVAKALQLHPSVDLVRYEVTTMYHTRYRELLMTHVADHGALPPLNADPEFSIGNVTLGRISPA